MRAFAAACPPRCVCRRSWHDRFTRAVAQSAKAVRSSTAVRSSSSRVRTSSAGGTAAQAQLRSASPLRGREFRASAVAAVRRNAVLSSLLGPPQEGPPPVMTQVEATPNSETGTADRTAHASMPLLYASTPSDGPRRTGFEASGSGSGEGFRV